MHDGSESVLSTKTPFGAISYYSFDRPIGEALELYGQWAMAEIRFLRQFLTPGDTVIDGGANIGTHTLAFAEACGPSGRVISVEASPEITPILERNIRDNALQGIDQINAALGDSAGTCRFARLASAGLQNVGMLSVVEGDADNASTVEVPVFTIDSLDLKSLRLIKLDIEGQELKAVKGAIKTIKRLRPIVAVELLDLGKSVPILNLLTAKGYKAFFCSFAAFEVDNFRGEDRNMFGVAREATLLFMPSGELPIETKDATVQSIDGIDDLAQLLQEMPRFGDRTDHDRKVRALLEDRAEFEKQLEIIKTLSATVAKAAATVETMESPRGLGHEIMTASTLTIRLLAVEDAIKKICDNTSIEPDTMSFASIQGQLRELWKALGEKIGSETVIGFRNEIGEFVRNSIGAQEEQNNAMVVPIMEELAHVRETLHLSNQRVVSAESDIELVHETIDRQVVETKGLRSGFHVQLEAMRTEFQEENRKVDESVTDIAEQLTALRDSQETLRPSVDIAIVRLKMEISSLREALLGRSEDRTSFVLTVEALDAKVGALAELATSVEVDRQLMHDKIDAFRRDFDERFQVLTERTEQGTSGLQQSNDAQSGWKKLMSPFRFVRSTR